MILGAGCDSIAAPAPQLPLLVPPGAYSLSAQPALSVSDATCSGSHQVIGGAVSGLVTVSYEGTVLVARSTTPDNGNLEVRLSASMARSGTIVVSGVARGTIIDRRAEQTIGTATLTFASRDDQPVAFTGTVHRFPDPLVSGEATGTVFAQSILGTETCQHATWGLTRT
jgi:hypothetical protein